METIKRIRLQVSRVRVCPDKYGAFRKPMGCSRDVAGVAQSLLAGEDVEVVIAFLLDAKHSVLGYTEIARGSGTQCVLTPADVFRIAVQLGAPGVILAHNHPSADVTPSQEDIAITRRLVKAGELLGIALLDHLVIAQGGGWFSFCDAGLLSPALQAS